ncbi:Polycomb group RING finger protein 3 [Plecturocebus cupreus]
MLRVFPGLAKLMVCRENKPEMRKQREFYHKLGMEVPGDIKGETCSAKQHLDSHRNGETKADDSSNKEAAEEKPEEDNDYHRSDEQVGGAQGHSCIIRARPGSREQVGGVGLEDTPVLFVLAHGAGSSISRQIPYTAEPRTLDPATSDLCHCGLWPVHLIPGPETQLPVDGLACRCLQRHKAHGDAVLALPWLAGVCHQLCPG